MKKIKLIIIVAIITVLIFAGIFLLTNEDLTGRVVEENHSTYTKAICNETNFCQDNIISCKNGEIESVSPITGAHIQHAKEWQDPRGKNGSEISCK